MARDKTPTKPAKAEKGKAEKPKKVADVGGFAKPSDAPATGGDGWKFEHDDNVGKLYIITPLRTEEVVGFENKTVEVVVADIVELNEKKPGKSEEHENAYIFGGWTKGSTRGYIGRKVLARLERDKAKGKGANAAWVLEDADAADLKVAGAYIESVVSGAVAELGGKAKKSKKK